MDDQDQLHQNALAYFKFFLTEKISIHLSTIAVAEYAVGDDPVNLPLDKMQIETFDFRDASTAGNLHSLLIGGKVNIEGYNRRIIANDVKILAQIKVRSIEAIITKDVASYSRFVKPLIESQQLDITFFDMNVPPNQVLGELFPIS